MKKIQVHYHAADGARGVVNYLSGDNAALSSTSNEKGTALRAVLMEKAKTFAGEWSKVFPGDQFFAAEI
jgi:hypothetical protein